MKKLAFILTILLLLATACTRKTNSAYLTQAKADIDAYAAVVELLDARIDEFQSDTSLLQEPAWSAGSLDILADLKAAAAAFRSLPEASTDLANLDGLLLVMADKTDQYVDIMTTSIENLDVEGITAAQDQRDSIRETLDDAQNELIRFYSGN
jgi:chaperonin cofactor prefoldin